MYIIDYEAFWEPEKIHTYRGVDILIRRRAYSSPNRTSLSKLALGQASGRKRRKRSECLLWVVRFRSAFSPMFPCRIRPSRPQTSMTTLSQPAIRTLDLNQRTSSFKPRLY
jgi:hypothetical protein